MTAVPSVFIPHPLCPCVVAWQELDLTSSFVTKAALIVKRKLEQKEPKHKPDRKEEKKAPVKPVAEPTKDKPVRAVPDAPKPDAPKPDAPKPDAPRPSLSKDVSSSS